YPEVVTPFNIHRLTNAVIRGPELYPGARTVIKQNGYVQDLRYAKPSTVNLEVGHIVERHLIHGDVVLFNRQPSLHRGSVMAHLVKVIHGKAFMLHPSCCKKYNADFDGDEMNLHVLQTIEAKAEAICIMSPK